MNEDRAEDAPRECCRTPGNCPIIPDHPDGRKDLAVRVCRVCGARHFQLDIDPGKVGLRSR